MGLSPLAEEHALDLAGKGDNLRVFLDAGERFKKVLETFPESKLGAHLPDAKKIRTALNIDKLVIKDTEPREQLSQRELEVLEYIAAGLTNQKISETLFVSMNTIKTHIRNIYTKLEVNSRTKAVAKAQELKLI